MLECGLNKAYPYSESGNMNQDFFQQLRREYSQKPFDEKDLASSPFKQFAHWFEQVLKEGLDMPNAMTLATVSNKGEPTARTVLLKSFDEAGFVFFTNYQSLKAQCLSQNPQASLLFYWSALDRQVRIQGKVEKTSGKESESYFHTRPLESQISASISPQSEVIDSRQKLEETFSQFKEQLASKEHAPLPDNWGGYRVIPHYFEFWQGRENRLHDRLVYEKKNENWLVKRLAP